MPAFLPPDLSANDPVFRRKVVPFAKPLTFLDRLLVEQWTRSMFRAPRRLGTVEEATYRALLQREEGGMVSVDLELLGETIDEHYRD